MTSRRAPSWRTLPLWGRSGGSFCLPRGLGTSCSWYTPCSARYVTPDHVTGATNKVGPGLIAFCGLFVGWLTSEPTSVRYQAGGSAWRRGLGLKQDADSAVFEPVQRQVGGRSSFVRGGEGAVAVGDRVEWASVHWGWARLPRSFCLVPLVIVLILTHCTRRLHHRAAVALTQISAYTHKNRTVRKVTEAMRTAYSMSALVLKTPQTTHDANDHGRHASIVTRIVCEERFFANEPGSKGAFEMRHLFLYFFSLVRISEFSYANFSSTCV